MKDVFAGDLNSRFGGFLFGKKILASVFGGSQVDSSREMFGYSNKWEASL